MNYTIKSTSVDIPTLVMKRHYDYDYDYDFDYDFDYDNYQCINVTICTNSCEGPKERGASTCCRRLPPNARPFWVGR